SASAGTIILPAHLPGPLGELADGPGQFSMTLGSSLQEVEAEFIRQTLQRLTGNRREAAAILGISVRSLQYKLKRYNITAK
ncbi:MAG: sigma-54-dependent Fis family transcriptional regulator, partial [Gemmatimonadota bacterium]|nr:sigma-54-dependent Fis family transcriptional regulator [Gemmatimonadota bacterium]